MELYRIGYDYRKAYSMLLIYSLIAGINTFVQNVAIGVLSALVGLGVLCVIYKDVFYDSLKLFGEIVVSVNSKINRAGKT